MKGLVVDEPWISLILSGQKTWEMRSRHTQRRGLIALIRKGSGQVVGMAQVTATRGPLSLSELEESFERHRVPPEEFRSGRAMAWNISWELAGATSLPQPVGYRHPPGAVTWVDLDEATSAQVLMQSDLASLGSTHRSFTTAGSGTVASHHFSADSSTTLSGPSDSLGDPLVPIARDQT